VFTKAPLYLRETLLFPYTAGLLFQQAAIEKYGQKGFTEVLTSPPATTSEVLHPERWQNGKPGAAPSLPLFEGIKGMKKLSGGTLGELDVRILAKQYASEDEAKSLAPHWRAGSYELYEDKKDKQASLRWAVELDSAEAAGQFLALYGRVIEGKWKSAKVEGKSSSQLTGSSDVGQFRIGVEGTVVRGLEGLKR